MLQICNFLGANLIESGFDCGISLFKCTDLPVPKNGLIEDMLQGIKPHHRSLLYATLAFNPEQRAYAS